MIDCFCLCSWLVNQMTFFIIIWIYVSLNEFVVPNVRHCFRFDPDLSLWKAINRKQKDFLATSDAKENSLLIGQQEWTIHNDSKSCSASTSYTRVLKLTGCGEGEFTCSDGQCIRGQTLIYQTSF